MVNFNLNAGSLMGILLAFAGVGLYFLRSFRPNLARDYDVFFAAVALLCGGILFFHSWRLDPILQFGVFLLTGSSVFFASDSIRLRNVTTEQAKRNTPLVDEDRPVSRVYRYESQFEEPPSYPYDSFQQERQSSQRRIRGSADSIDPDYQAAAAYGEAGYSDDAPRSTRGDRQRRPRNSSSRRPRSSGNPGGDSYAESGYRASDRYDRRDQSPPRSRGTGYSNGPGSSYADRGDYGEGGYTPSGASYGSEGYDAPPAGYGDGGYSETGYDAARYDSGSNSGGAYSTPNPERPSSRRPRRRPARPPESYSEPADNAPYVDYRPLNPNDPTDPDVELDNSAHFDD